MSLLYHFTGHGYRRCNGIQRFHRTVYGILERLGLGRRTCRARLDLAVHCERRSQDRVRPVGFVQHASLLSSGDLLGYPPFDICDQCLWERVSSQPESPSHVAILTPSHSQSLSFPLWAVLVRMDLSFHPRPCTPVYRPVRQEDVCADRYRHHQQSQVS